MQTPAPAETLWSIALAGGKGTRLADARKRLERGTHPHLPAEAWGTAGPKALASMRAGTGGPVKPMIEWHLDIHASCGRVERIILAAGAGGELLDRHFRATHGGSYRGVPVELLIEERPAGTIAPIVKLHAAGRLPARPVVYANADNLLDADLYDCYRQGLERAAACGIDAEECVIDVAALVPLEESGDYGALDLDESCGLVRGFREKAPAERNPFLECGGRRWTPINSGFSIIPNPRRLFGNYLSDEIMRISQALERGELEYVAHEDAVKYESLYERIAAAGRMVAVPASGYWTDLGTEAKIRAAEARLAGLGFIAPPGKPEEGPEPPDPSPGAGAAASGPGNAPT